jgi:hypothetical protein
MKNFEFTIIASGLDPEAADFETRFFDAGCDDATIGFQKGHILIDFARDAATLTEAIATAIASVAAAGAEVERVEPDPLVSLSDIAARSGLGRAAISNYYKGSRLEGFPPPKLRVTSSSPLWDWADVAEWLFRQGRISRDEAVEAGVVSAANELLDCDPQSLPTTLKRRAEELEVTFNR